MIAVAHGQSLASVTLSMIALPTLCFGCVGIAVWRDKWQRKARR